MTRSIVWLHQAASEYHEAVRGYAAVSSSLSQPFEAAVDNTVQTAAESPFRFTVISNSRRRAGVRHFPFAIFYFVEESRIAVIACFHGKRDPQGWQNR